MRAHRLLFGLLVLALTSTVAPAGAASRPSTADPCRPPSNAPCAETYAVVWPDEFGNALVLVACTGRGSPQESARVVVECDLYDDSGGPSIHHERSYAGFAGACFVAAQGARLPVEFCTTITVQYRSLSEESATHCSHAGDFLPPHNPPAPPKAGQVQCADLVRPPEQM